MFKFSRDVTRVCALAFAMLILQSSLSIAQVTVSLPTVPGQAAGTSVVLPISVGNLTGQKVTAYQFAVTYNPHVLKITSASATGTISSAMQVASTVDTVAGKITVAAAGSAALSGAGILLNLNATVLSTGTTTLTWQNFTFNEGTPAATLKNGSLGGSPALNVTVPAVADTVGAAVMIAINTDTLTGQNVYSYQFSASYDTTVLQLTGTGYSTTGTVSASQSLSVDASMTPGTITIAAAGTAALTGGGTLIYLTGKILKIGTSAITLAGFEYNEGTPTVGVSSGSVAGIMANRPPVINSFTPATLNRAQIGSSQTFTVTATDPNPNDTLSYTWSVNNVVKQTGHSSSFTTTLSDSGNAVVKVVVTDLGGLSDSTSWSFLVTAVNKLPGLPTKFELGQNYPNPFNPTTVISFDVPKMASVKIVVYDILGREVRTLLNQNMAAGRYTATWNGLNDYGQQVSTGVYFYRMDAGNFVSMKKMLLLK